MSTFKVINNRKKVNTVQSKKEWHILMYIKPAKKGQNYYMAFILMISAGFVMSSHAADGGQGNSSALYVDPNGNVGIGTEEPAAQLEVKESSKADQLDVTGVITAGQVNAGKLTGDGSQISVGKAGTLEEEIKKKLIRLGERSTAIWMSLVY